MGQAGLCLICSSYVCVSGPAVITACGLHQNRVGSKLSLAGLRTYMQSFLPSLVQSDTAKYTHALKSMLHAVAVMESVFWF